MSSVVGLITFPTTDGAGAFLKSIKKLQKSEFVELHDHVVIVKDVDGHTKADESSPLTKKRGAVTGGTLGFVLGVMVGGPIGAAALGTAVGYFTTKKLDVGVGKDKIKSIADGIDDDSSALFLHVSSSKEGLLKTAVRNAGGKIEEISFTDDQEVEISATMADFASRYDEAHGT